MKARHPQEKAGESRRPVFHPRGPNPQKFNGECNQRRIEAGSFRVRIVWVVIMKLMKVSAHRKTMEDNSVDQMFQQPPGRDANQDQMEAIHASQVHENRGTVAKSPKCRIRLIRHWIDLAGAPRHGPVG